MTFITPPNDPKKTQPPERLYTTKEAAKILGVSPDTLYCWKSTKRYDLPVVKMGGRNKYRLSDLMSFIEARTINKLGE